VENAQAVADYFLHLHPYVYATGDLSEWTALTHPDCIFCHSVINEVNSIRQVGQTMRGGVVTTSEPRVLEPNPGRAYEVNFRVDFSPADVFDSTGAVVQSNPSSTGTIDMLLIWEDGRWVVREVTPTQDAQG
jgi:hypothetical protein